MVYSYLFKCLFLLASASRQPLRLEQNVSVRYGLYSLGRLLWLQLAPHRQGMQSCSLGMLSILEIHDLCAAVDTSQAGSLERLLRTSILKAMHQSFIHSRSSSA